MKTIFTTVLICIMLCGFAQTGKQPAKGKTPTPVETHKKIYEMAVQNADASVAINSLYYIVAEEGKTSLYRDTLALLYFNMASYVQCELVAAGIVKDFADSIEKGQKLSVLEALALSQSSLGKVKEAIQSFEKLLGKTNEMYHGYRLAEMQYTYQRVGEAMQTVLAAERLQNSMKGKVSIDLGNKQTQAVSLEAALQNLKGYILLKEYPDQKAAAITAFKKALEIQPDFVLAKNNLDYAEGKSPTEQQAPSQTPPPAPPNK